MCQPCMSHARWLHVLTVAEHPTGDWLAAGMLNGEWKSSVPATQSAGFTHMMADCVWGMSAMESELMVAHLGEHIND